MSSMWLVLANKRLGLRASGVGSHSTMNHAQSGKERKQAASRGCEDTGRQRNNAKERVFHPLCFAQQRCCTRGNQLRAHREPQDALNSESKAAAISVTGIRLLSRFLQHRGKTTWS